MSVAPGATERVGASAQAAIVARYEARSPASRQAHARAGAMLPGGVNRNIVHHGPHPLFVERGEGAYLVDLDGNRYLDLVGNYTAMILGHRHPAVSAAVAAQLERGTAWANPSAAESELASRIADRLPSVERVRFTSSGTEAAMMAIRAARAHTGRPLIAKIEGGYHGLYDDALVSVSPPLDAVGPESAPAAIAPAGIRGDATLVLPFNRPDDVRALVERHSGQLAALLVEPLLGVAGMIEPESGFLALLRELSDRHGFVLVFDEVISLRVGPGGMQEREGVRPDLTVLGKIVGGGFPIGVVGGAERIMRVFDPNPGAGPAVLLSGTFHANPVTLAAGIATLDALTPEALAELNARGDRLRAGLRETLHRAGLTAQVTGVGSLFNVHFTAEPITSYRAAASGDTQLLQWLALALLNEGVMVAPRGLGCLSTPVTDADVDRFLAAVARALDALKVRN